MELKKWQEKKKGLQAEIKKLCQQVAAPQATEGSTRRLKLVDLRSM